MNHLNNCVHRWRCVSGSRWDGLLPHNNGIPLHDLNWLYLRISNSVAYRYPDNGSLTIHLGQVYIPHKCSWSKFKLPFWWNSCLGDQFGSGSFDLQRLDSWIMFTGHTSMAYDQSEWKIDHWIPKSTKHSLRLPRQPSTIVCRPGTQACSVSHQSLLQQVEHNVSAILETLITQLRMHAQMYFIISTRIFNFPCQRFKPER